MTITEPAFAGPTADEILAGIDLTGRRALVTGATSGIGAATASALSRAGAEVTTSSRENLDLSDLESVKAFVSGWQGPLDILINNAGIMAVPDRRLSAQGQELQFATNHLGHFALTVGLESALERSGRARIVSVSSGAHRRSPVVFDDIDFERREYDPWLAYAQSKTANILFAVGAASRWARIGVIANSCHPGSIITDLGRFVGEVNSAPAAELKSPAQGAATSVFLATRVDDISGKYFKDETVTEASDYALDPELADRLWETSIRMLGE